MCIRGWHQCPGWAAGKISPSEVSNPHEFSRRTVVWFLALSRDLVMPVSLTGILEDVPGFQIPHIHLTNS